MSGIWRCLNPMPFHGVFTPGIIVCITDWTAKVSVCHERLFYCDPVHTGCLAIVPILWAVSYWASMFVGLTHSYITIGLCHVVVPCVWAFLLLCKLNAWSHDLGVLCDLKLSLAIFARCKKIPSGAIHHLMLLWKSRGHQCEPMPDQNSLGLKLEEKMVKNPLGW